MSVTSGVSPNFVTAVNVRTSKFDWTIITLICLCVIPTMATIDLGRPLLGARYLVGTLFLCLGYYGLRKDRYRFFSLLLGSAPALGLMRGLFFYDSIIFFLIVGIIVWSTAAWSEVEFVAKDPLWRSLTALCVLYWFLSVLMTHDWHSNSRTVELGLSAAAICLIANRRSYLATAIVGMSISISAYAIAMLPYGVRLGEGELDNGQTIGNPALLGIPSALIVLLALTDRGRLLMMEKNVFGRLLICLSAGEWLVLSGSRGSWTITIVSLILVFTYSKASRKPLLIMLGVGCLATIVVLSTSRGDKITNVFGKTVDSNRTLANRTSGRSSMWAALPSIFSKSPIWGWGAGSGRNVDYIYTGRHLELHSLYLQVIAETGLLGFLPLMTILVLLIRRSILHLRRYGEVVPLIGVVGYMLIGVSVTAFDIVSGIYLGLAFMAREPQPRFTGYTLWAAPAEEEEELVSS